MVSIIIHVVYMLSEIHCYFVFLQDHISAYEAKRAANIAQNAMFKELIGLVGINNLSLD